MLSFLFPKSGDRSNPWRPRLTQPGRNCAHCASAPGNDEDDMDLTNRTFAMSTLGIDSLKRQQKKQWGWKKQGLQHDLVENGNPVPRASRVYNGGLRYLSRLFEDKQTNETPTPGTCNLAGDISLLGSQFLLQDCSVLYEILRSYGRAPAVEWH